MSKLFVSDKIYIASDGTSILYKTDILAGYNFGTNCFAC
jgi:hypothetical protein